MMVNLYGIYRDLAGGKTIELEIAPASTTRQLLTALVRHCPQLRPELLDEHGNLYAHVPVFLNGRNPRLLDSGLDTVLMPEDVLSVFSPIASGRLNVEDIQQAVVQSGQEEYRS